MLKHDALYLIQLPCTFNSRERELVSVAYMAKYIIASWPEKSALKI